METTRVAIVMDRSSSMGSVTKEAVDSFNEQVDALKSSAESDKNLAFFVDSIFFNTEVNVRDHANPVASVAPMTVEEYAPNGMTALYDAVYKAIEKIESNIKPGEAAFIIIITDGQENASKNTSQEKLAEKIKSLQNAGNWTFTYMCTDDDLSEVTRKLNIPHGNVAQFAANAIGTKGMGTRNAAMVSNYASTRSGGGMKTNSAYSPSSSSSLQQAAQDQAAASQAAQAAAQTAAGTPPFVPGAPSLGAAGSGSDAPASAPASASNDESDSAGSSAS